MPKVAETAICSGRHGYLNLRNGLVGSHLMACQLRSTATGTVEQDATVAQMTRAVADWSQ